MPPPPFAPDRSVPLHTVHLLPATGNGSASYLVRITVPDLATCSLVITALHGIIPFSRRVTTHSPTACIAAG